MAMDDSTIVTGYRALSCISYLLTFICSAIFMGYGLYLAVIVALYTMAASVLVLLSVIGQPTSLMDKLNTHAEFLFTYKGRIAVDVFLALFLFGMGPFGVSMAIIHLVLIIGIRLLAASFPGAFEQLFRVPNSQDDFDSPYGPSDTTGGFTQPTADL